MTVEENVSLFCLLVSDESAMQSVWRASGGFPFRSIYLRGLQGEDQFCTTKKLILKQVFPKKNHLIIFFYILSLIFDNRKTSCTKTISACEKHQDKYPLETKRYAWMLKDFFVSKYTEFERRKKCYQNNVMKWRIGMT